MTLRQFEREAARKQEEMRKGRHTKREVKKTHLKETEKDKNLLLVKLLKQKTVMKNVVSVCISFDGLL